MKLPIPINYNGEIYTDAEIEKPRAGILADTKKMADTGKWFSAISILVAGCIESLSGEKTITDKTQIKTIAKYIPYRTAEYLALKAILKIFPDDGFEGLYDCPRCGHEIITELQKDGDLIISDTRDYVSDLEVVFMEEIEISVNIELTDPVIIKNRSTGDVLQEISSFEIAYPVLKSCMAAQGKYGANDSIRTQFAIYVESLISVNGESVDAKWRNRWGMSLFDNLKDYGKLDIAMSKYGMTSTVEKVCSKCGKKWNATVNTSNFFASALRVM